ncbi:MAG TPA: hypothetical protein DCM14_09620 [Clostridiales bacterium UBA8153]|nr:hypothetical protein [Clostridiales bacterium UBA8153]
MEEERLLVLQMVADGKITAEEAAALLRALDATRRVPSDEEAGGGSEAGKHAGIDVGELGRKLGEKAEVMAQVIAERVEKRATRLEEGVEGPGWLQNLLGGLNLGHLFAAHYKSEDTISGIFEHEGDVQLDLSTFNGRIDLETWNRPEFEFRVVKTIRAPQAEEAAELAAKLVRFAQDGKVLKLEAASPAGTWNCGVAIYGRLPEGRSYDAQLTTTNGRIVVAGLKAGILRARTSNGRVVAGQVAVTKHAEVKTSNGKIEFSGSSPQLVARTSNGRIVVSPSPGQGGEYDLSTSNGSIRLQLVTSPDTGYDVEATTSNAKIVTELGEVEMLAEEKRPGRQHVHARTRGFEDRRHQVLVRAKTSNGPIRIGPDLE